jgi:hypothetical protein
MSGRSRSLAMTVFFEAELLGVNEIPHRSIINLEATLGKFGDQSAQSKLSLSNPLHEKGVMLTNNGLRLVPAHLARRHAADVLETPDPIDHRADPKPKLGRRPMSREPAPQNRRNGTLTKIHGIRFRHPCWPPSPASMLNQNIADSGIPNRFSPISSRSKVEDHIVVRSDVKPFSILAMISIVAAIGLIVMFGVIVATYKAPALTVKPF